MDDNERTVLAKRDVPGVMPTMDSIEQKLEVMIDKDLDTLETEDYNVTPGSIKALVESLLQIRKLRLQERIELSKIESGNYLERLYGPGNVVLDKEIAMKQIESLSPAQIRAVAVDGGE